MDCCPNKRFTNKIWNKELKMCNYSISSEFMIKLKMFFGLVVVVLTAKFGFM